MYQNGENKPNDHKIFQKLTKWPLNIPYSIARPSKIYPIWDFWFENKASGNPDPDGCAYVKCER
jgi:hypothetical protein